MRFIIREQPYERLVAAGQWRYEQDGRPTGAVESWRLTTAAAGYRFLRVDLDARHAPSGNTFLYHLVWHEDGRPERLRYRFWNLTQKVVGNVLLDDTQVIATHEANGRPFEVVHSVTTPYQFWFPAIAGLGVLAAQPPAPTAVCLQSDFHLSLTQLNRQEGQQTELYLMGKQWVGQPLSVRWADQLRTIWLDTYHWPLKMVRGDGLTAVAVRYMRHQQEHHERN